MEISSKFLKNGSNFRQGKKPMSQTFLNYIDILNLSYT